MGYDKPRSLGGSAQAALYTAPIFRDFMKMALKDTPDTPFRIPPGIKLISVDVHTGMRGERRRLDHGGVQARHWTARQLWRRRWMGESAQTSSRSERSVGAGTGGLY